MTDEQILANRAEWVKALRSGQFEQDKGYLCQVYDLNKELPSITKYCCLGVACEISPCMGIQLKVEREQNGRNVYFNNQDMDLPPEMFILLGLSKDAHQTLIEMNDTRNATFEEIADFIETLPIYHEEWRGTYDND